MLLRAALSALLLSLVFSHARAADLSGACCADVEERVAELEATAAKHGNRKMMVVIYGQVNYGWVDYTGISGVPAGHSLSGIAMNSAAPTFLGIAGEAKVNASLKAGFKLEFQMDDRPNLATASAAFPNEVVMRQGVLWLDTVLGKVSVGHGSMASDNAGSVTVANTEVASRLLSIAPMSTVLAFGYDLPYNDVRRDMARYDTPTFLGFTVSASIANGDNVNVIGGPFPFNAKDAYDIALRYANEIGGAGGFRVAAAIAYRDEQQQLATLAIGFPTRSTVFDGSTSVMHMPTGIFLSVAGGVVRNDTLWGSFENYQVQGGWEKAIFKDIGATTLFAEWATMHLDTPSKDINMYGLGAVQNIQGLAMDIYGDWKRYDASAFARGPQFDQFMVGARVKF